MLDKIERLMWKYLIDNGSVIQSHSHYGVTVDIESTLAYRENFQSLDIDWEKTKGVKDGTESRFTGTFSEPEMITFLKGTLVEKDGTKTNWFFDYTDEPINVLELVREFIPEDILI